MISTTVTNYVKAVFRLTQDHADQPATTGRLAKVLNVSPGTVTSMLKTLRESGLATYTPYEGAQLTDQGRALALKTFRRHRLLECFLCRTLGLDWDEVHEDAARMEHDLSDLLVERIDQYLGYPKYDPHGDPIPAADGTILPRQLRPLTTCEQGMSFRLAQVANQSPEFLRYLTELELPLGTKGTIVENRPEAGLTVIQTNDRQITLGHDAAASLMVSLGEMTNAAH